MNRIALFCIALALAAGCKDDTVTYVAAATDDDGSGGDSDTADSDATSPDPEDGSARTDSGQAEIPIEERRIVAVGDVHGDLASALEALQLAGAVNAEGDWIGGDLIVVQVGDQTDRGDDEREIIDWFERLQVQASDAGGALYPLLGNHEVMNVQLDLRYVTDGGYEDFADIPYDETEPPYDDYEPEQRGRVAAFRPGGPYAELLSDHHMVLQLGANIFVHGGLVPRFAEMGIEAINGDVSAWMRGEAPEPDAVRGDDCPIWSRHFSRETGPAECALLEQTLELLDADRMIVAHTVQDNGITSACDGQVWRVDVGLSDYYGGDTQVLEIIGDQVTPVQ